MDAEPEQALADVEWELLHAAGEVNRPAWWRDQLVTRNGAAVDGESPTDRP